jgi:radical SAM protein with 4Fe4S-binding SPASM domain
MQMDCHGNLFPCASLYKRYHRLGNIKDMTIQEAWNCDYIKKLREEMLTGKLNDVCKNCLEKTEHVHRIDGIVNPD